MTTAFPGQGDDPGDGDRRPVDDDEISRRFTAIVSGISDQMNWDEREPGPEPERNRPDPAQHTAGPPPPVPPPPLGTIDQDDPAERRRRRREQRQAEREQEVAAFAADQARREAEYAADDEHFVPGDPPPLHRPKVRTVVAVLLVLFGFFLLLGPNILAIGPNAVLILSVTLVLSGSALLVAGMRTRHHDPGEGWDDGSQV